MSMRNIGDQRIRLAEKKITCVTNWFRLKNERVAKMEICVWCCFSRRNFHINKYLFVGLFLKYPFSKPKSCIQPAHFFDDQKTGEEEKNTVTHAKGTLPKKSSSQPHHPCFLSRHTQRLIPRKLIVAFKIMTEIN